MTLRNNGFTLGEQCSKALTLLVDDCRGLYYPILSNILGAIIIHEIDIPFITNQYDGMTEGFEHSLTDF